HHPAGLESTPWGWRGTLFDSLRTTRAERLTACREELARAVERTTEEVEAAVAFGLLRVSARDQYVARVEDVRRNLPQTFRFGPAHETLEEVRAAIARKHHEEVENVRRLLQRGGVGPGHPAHARISAVLDRGDVGTACEYIDLLRRGIPLPESAPV